MHIFLDFRAEMVYKLLIRYDLTGRSILATSILLLIYFVALIAMKIMALKKSPTETSGNKEINMTKIDKQGATSASDSDQVASSSEDRSKSEEPEQGAEAKNLMKNSTWETAYDIGMSMGALDVAGHLFDGSSHMLPVCRKGLPMRRPFSFG